MSDFDGERRGGGGGGGARRGGSGKGEFNRHRNTMNFQQHVPKFIQAMLSKNPSVKLQGQQLHARRGEDGEGVGGFDAMAQDILIQAAMDQSSSTTSSRRPDEEEGRERPEYEDEAPQIDNIEQFASEDLTHILSHLAKKATNENATSGSADSASSSSSVSAAAASSASSSSSSAPVALS